MAVALPGGLLTYGYPDAKLPSGAPCGLPGNQGITHGVAGSRLAGTLGVSFPIVPEGYLHHLALEAGPATAVVGFHDGWTNLGLFLRPFDIATGEPGPPYFTDGIGGAPPAPPSVYDVLLVREDGLLLTLMGGSLVGWRPGEASPMMTRLLDLDLEARGPFLQSLHFTGPPHVRHSGDVVTLALGESGGERRVIVLELNADLSVRWAWRSEPSLAFQAHCSLYGIPDGSEVDLVCWADNGRDQYRQDCAMRPRMHRSPRRSRLVTAGLLAAWVLALAGCRPLAEPPPGCAEGDTADTCTPQAPPGTARVTIIKPKLPSDPAQAPLSGRYLEVTVEVEDAQAAREVELLCGVRRFATWSIPPDAGVHANLGAGGSAPLLGSAAGNRDIRCRSSSRWPSSIRSGPATRSRTSICAWTSPRWRDCSARTRGRSTSRLRPWS